jgi:hypothetical protein
MDIVQNLTLIKANLKSGIEAFGEQSLKAGGASCPTRYVPTTVKLKTDAPFVLIFKS